MQFSDLSYSGSWVACHRFSDFFIFCNRYFSVYQQGRTKGQNVGNIIIHQRLCRGFRFPDNIKGAVGIYYKIFIGRIGSVSIKRGIPYNVTAFLCSVIITVDSEYGVCIFSHIGSRFRDIFSVSIVCQYGIEIFGRADRDISSVYGGILKPVLINAYGNFFRVIASDQTCVFYVRNRCRGSGAVTLGKYKSIKERVSCKSCESKDPEYIENFKAGKFFQGSALLSFRNVF